MLKIEYSENIPTSLKVSLEVIIINKQELNDSGIKENIAILHEAGHWLDYSLNFKYKKDFVKSRQGLHQIETEKRAWEYAFKLHCLLYNKPPKKDFFRDRDLALQSYLNGYYMKKSGLRLLRGCQNE